MIPWIGSFISFCLDSKGPIFMSSSSCCNNSGSKTPHWCGDVLVIGSGWSGMLVAKHCREHGLNVRIVEKGTYAGGVWKYQEDEAGGVMLSTQTTSSWAFTESSDFPLRAEDGLNSDFPRHDLVMGYLERYCVHNKLGEITDYCTCVQSVTKDKDNNFNVLMTDGRLYVSERLNVSTGFLGNPRSKGFEVSYFYENLTCFLI